MSVGSGKNRGRATREESRSHKYRGVVGDARACVFSAERVFALRFN